MKKMGALVRLIRPVNCIMMGFAVIVGAALANKNILLQQVQSLLLGFSTGFLLTAAAMAINDYYDRKIDSLNEPSRPIPSGLISPREALGIAFLLTLAGLSAAFLTGGIANWECLAIASVSWIIVILYVTKGKSTGLPGNLLVSICIAIPFVYGSYAIGQGLIPSMSIFAAMVFLSNTGREITKGIVDVQGDRENQIKTIAVSLGEKKAAIAAAAFYLSAVSLTPLPRILGIASFWYLPFVVLTDIGLGLASMLLLLNPSKENARNIKNRNLLWFFSGLLAFLLGTFT
ncbi:MAG: UbiA family prenyltransferase [Candidatus Bathyarchaeota archaeon]|nr:MAG: UbiA family prenyltransferase [Candidatus Bathyarchaeota archaeon]